MNRPLTGIRVTGLEQYMAGPYCTLLLADAGAEVIKIERPGKGDPRRSIPPFIEKGGVKQAAGFMGYNRNKKSLALDIAHPKGQEIYKKLIATSDVVVENLRPGSMDRQGLGFDAMRRLNPRLIWAVISGFGRMPGFQGPYSDRPAFDIVAEAMGGIMHQVGFADRPPSWTIYGMADIYTGMVTAYGVMQALFARERTGEGQLVDSSMLDNMLGAERTGPRRLFGVRPGDQPRSTAQRLATRRLSNQGRLYRAQRSRQHHLEPPGRSGRPARSGRGRPQQDCPGAFRECRFPAPDHRGLAGRQDASRSGGHAQRRRRSHRPRLHRRGHFRRSACRGARHVDGSRRHQVRPYRAASVVQPHPAGGSRSQAWASIHAPSSRLCSATAPPRSMPWPPKTWCRRPTSEKRSGRSRKLSAGPFS